jgi:thermostable 8-oxoguanine DNA glycosylase
MSDHTTINPTSITNFNRSTAEKQAFWIFCVLVAGRNSNFAAQKVAQLLQKSAQLGVLPFEFFRSLGEVGLDNFLRAHRVGQYSRISQAIYGSLDLDLNICTLDSLLTIYGVGPKTARFFLLHTRQHEKYAVLDTHILKWLVSCGVEGVPTSTPQNQKTYKHFERVFLSLVEHRFPLLSLAQVDLIIWSEMSGRAQEDLTKE